MPKKPALVTVGREAVLDFMAPFEEVTRLKNLVRQELKVEIEKVSRSGTLDLRVLVDLCPNVVYILLYNGSDHLCIVGSGVEISENKEQELFPTLLISEETHVHFENNSKKPQIGGSVPTNILYAIFRDS